MNILFLDQFSDPGGAQLCLLDLLPAVRECGWNAHVAAPQPGPLLDRARALGATADMISLGPFRSGTKSASDLLRFAGQFPRLHSEIAKLIQRYRIDLLYVNGPRVLPAAGRIRLPQLFHCHNRIKSRYALWLAGHSLRVARGTVVASCHFLAEPLRRFVPTSRLHVVYNGVRESARACLPKRGRTIGLIGRVHPDKGQAEFVRAARIVSQTVPGCRFVICGAPLFGDGVAIRYWEALRSMAAGLPVEFTGWREDVSEILARLDVLVVPSLIPEANPRVILEAFAADVPVIASGSGGISEVIADDETGFLVESPGPEALARRLIDLLNRPQKLEQAARAANAAWRERFTLARYQKEMLDLMERSATGTQQPQRCKRNIETANR